MRTCIIVDCDDVLYRCNLESVSKLNQEIGSSYSIEDITHWGMMKNPLDQRIKYFSDPDFVSNIPLYLGAKEFISALCEYADVVLASCINKECMEVREKSLKMNFPQIKDIYLGDTKKHIYGDILLDDGLHNLSESPCKHLVVFDQPWNRNNSDFERVHNYSEFLSLVENL